MINQKYLINNYINMEWGTTPSTLYVAGINKASCADGEGFRYVVFCSYCTHHCKGCHNQKYWELDSGVETNTINIFNDIISQPNAVNVTFSGGEPFLQTNGFIELAKMIKNQTNKTIWCYTGFLFKELLLDNKKFELLKLIDVLVDGQFVEELKDYELSFKGSSNQRIIDVPKSLFKGEIVLWS